jgi:hypothetical protein
MEISLHFLICLISVLVNKLSAGTTLPFKLDELTLLICILRGVTVGYWREEIVV